MRYRLAKSDVELVPLRFCCGVPSRAGLSLLEVVLGTAILSMALAVLAQQSAVGVQAALRCQLQSEAAIHCQTQMDRLLAGRLALRTVRDQQIEGVAGWRWSVTVRSSAVPNLLEIRLEVYRESQPLLSRCHLLRLSAISAEGAAGLSVTSFDGAGLAGG
jgi:hypothetical protein